MLQLANAESFSRGEDFLLGITVIMSRAYLSDSVSRAATRLCSELCSRLSVRPRSPRARTAADDWRAASLGYRSPAEGTFVRPLPLPESIFPSCGSSAS